MYKSKWSDDDKNLVAEFTKQGYSLEEIAAEMEITRDEVKYLRQCTKSSSRRSNRELLKGSLEDVQARLIKIMQDSPIIGYAYFNSKDSDTPAATTYRKYFGSWENALRAAGRHTNENAGNDVINKFSMKPDRPTTVYLVEFEGFYKIGITQQTIKQRLGGRYPPYTIVMQIDTSLEEAKDIERQWLENVKHLQYTPTSFPAEGRGFTECFKV